MTFTLSGYGRFALLGVRAAAPALLLLALFTGCTGGSAPVAPETGDSAPGAETIKFTSVLNDEKTQVTLEEPESLQPIMPNEVRFSFDRTGDSETVAL